MMLAMRDTRASRRILALGAGLIWVALISPFPRSLDGLGMLMTLVLLALDIELGVATGWVAFSRSPRLDERQAAVRDRAYRLAFRLIALGAIAMIISAVFGSIASGPSAPQPEPVLGGRWVVALLQLLLALPTLVIAWLEPGTTANGEAGPTSRRTSYRLLPFLVVPAVATLWLYALVALPVRASGAQDAPGHSMMGGATCGHFVATREVGYGFGVQFRIDIEPCWDGTRAFTFPHDPKFSSRCMPLPGTADFARIGNLKCAERTDGDGSIHYSMQGSVDLAPGAPVRRNVKVELVVSPDGRASTIG